MAGEAAAVRVEPRLSLPLQERMRLARYAAEAAKRYDVAAALRGSVTVDVPARSQVTACAAAPQQQRTASGTLQPSPGSAVPIGRSQSEAMPGPGGCVVSLAMQGDDDRIRHNTANLCQG